MASNLVPVLTAKCAESKRREILRGKNGSSGAFILMNMKEYKC